MYLLWTLLNFALFIFFIIICFKATKLIREKLGLPAALIFVIGLLSFMSVKDNVNGNIEIPNNKVQQAHFNFIARHELEPQSLEYASQKVETHLGSSLNMETVFGKQTLTGKKNAVDTYFILSGLMGGHIWAIHSVSILPTSIPNKFSYKVQGSLKWLLLGFPVFSQAKILQGIIDVKNSNIH